MAFGPKSGPSRTYPNVIPSDVPKPPGAKGRDTTIRNGGRTPRATGVRPSKFSKGRGLRPRGKK